MIAEKDLTCNVQAASIFLDKCGTQSGKSLKNIHVVKNYQHVTFLAPRQPQPFFEILDQILFKDLQKN